MSTKQVNVRLPAHTIKQLESLAKRFGMTKTQVLILAIDRLAAKERNNG